MTAKKKSESESANKKSANNTSADASTDVREELKKIFDDILTKMEDNPIRYSDIKHVIHKIRELL